MSNVKGDRGADIKTRLLNRSHTRPTDGSCWEWNGCFDSRGYGTMQYNLKFYFAHRASYEIYVGKIEPGFEIDHLCRNHGCINPTHLEAVSHRLNLLRGFAPAAINHRKTHCKNGHLLKESALARRCHICVSAYKKEWRKQKCLKRLENILKT